MIYKGVELYNVRDLVDQGPSGAVALSRVPAAVRARLNPMAQGAALAGCGVEIRFNLDGPSATVTLQRLCGDDVSPVGIAEVYHGAFQSTYGMSPRPIGPEPTRITVLPLAELALLDNLTARHDAPFDPQLVRIILPYDAPTMLWDVAGDVSPPRIEQAPRAQYVAYGSSITHGSSAVGPTETYAMRVARLLRMDLINLGFAGSAHLDDAMAAHIADDLSWDIASLELGINVIDRWSLVRFAEGVRDFVGRIAAAHPDKWVFCTDIVTTAGDFRGDDKNRAFRAVVRREVAALGLSKVVYCSGRDLLVSPTGLTADGVHPSVAGMGEIAINLHRHMRESGATAR